ncbi:uncharacterized protein THITE_2123365 [Thermothielavioides terrestris NRRL 8126]|uniref:Uncharacterized protein n=1 Tax=Thermothielavioides terrestris (strain ATCC 38088 / NRRL 8126) TaxID=578455 RepID=G2RH91_THETT|nr:uncharacterized protein THITE_2123365 [Thermothielavioides terrestris NRRL 8126]AEO71203.1 hypothetical protein THITE_2123365 [Thermothielavioides terrestris NRRL 8126]
MAVVPIPTRPQPVLPSTRLTPTPTPAPAPTLTPLFLLLPITPTPTPTPPPTRTVTLLTPIHQPHCLLENQELALQHLGPVLHVADLLDPPRVRLRQPAQPLVLPPQPRRRPRHLPLLPPDRRVVHVQLRRPRREFPVQQVAGLRAATVAALALLLLADGEAAVAVALVTDGADGCARLIDAAVRGIGGDDNGIAGVCL